MRTKYSIKLRFVCVLLLLLGVVFKSDAQKVSAKLLNKENNEPIPFASIQFSEKEGTMSNEEGSFEFLKPERITVKDSLEIFSMGFKTKKLCLLDPIPEVIYLNTEIFPIAPVVLTNDKMTVNEIIDKVKRNLAKNYLTSYTKVQVFIRETYKQQFNEFRFDLKNSTIDNIDQDLFDSIINKIPDKFTSLIESYGDAYLYDNSAGKIQLIKAMIIQSKHQKSSVKRVQNDFLQALRDNTRPDSYLIIKSGVLRLDKTESIDSIVNQTNTMTKEEVKKKRLTTQKRRNNVLNKLVENLFFNKKASMDFLSKPGRYRFVKIGYEELKNGLAYVIEFKPKGSSKYKGKLYINTTDFAIVKSEVQGAKKIFNKHINIFGIKANDLTYKNTVFFKKEIDDRYHIKYIRTETTQEVGINRPFQIIEKNKYVKGRNTQNKVSLRMIISMHNHDVKEIVFKQPKAIFESEYKDLKQKNDFKIGRFNAYDKNFWNEYNILTPKKAIRQISIEE